MSKVGLIVVLLVVFLCFGFSSPLSPLLCFITVVLFIFVSLWCFTAEVENLYADWTYICTFNLELYQNKEWGLKQVKLVSAPQEVSYLLFQSGSSVVVLLPLCVCCFICGICLYIFVPHLSLVPDEDCASWFWHILAFTRIFYFNLIQFKPALRETGKAPAILDVSPFYLISKSWETFIWPFREKWANSLNQMISNLTQLAIYTQRLCKLRGKRRYNFHPAKGQKWNSNLIKYFVSI